MNTANKEFTSYAERELTAIVMRFVNTLEEQKANQIAREIVNLIDWNNSTLMHKGFSWMAKNYLLKRNMI